MSLGCDGPLPCRALCCSRATSATFDFLTRPALSNCSWRGFAFAMSAVLSGICATPCGTQERCAPDSRMALAQDQVSGTHTKLPSRASKRPRPGNGKCTAYRSEEHTSELQSLMRSSYAVFCLKKKK